MSGDHVETCRTEPGAGRWILTALLLLGLLPLACGGGGDGGGGGGVVLPSTCASFSDGLPEADNTIVARQGASTTCDLVAVELMITNVNDVFAVDFTVTFDSSLFAYAGVDTTGSLLVSDGADVLMLDSGPAGQILVGVSRVGSTGINATGTMKLLTLQFRKLSGTGSGTLGFTNPKVLDSQAQPTPIPGVSWSGGTLKIE